MVELLPQGEVRPLSREARTLGDSLTIAVLTISSVITLILFVVKGILDQLPGVFRSWRRVIEAMHGNAGRREGETDPQSGQGD
ncbi:hypothetical protein ACWGKQ_01785 [Streptomyces sp. NPDC054770]